MRPILLLIALSGAVGCALAGADSDLPIVELDEKADFFTGVDVGRAQLFHMVCDLERCRYDLTFKGALTGGDTRQPLLIALGGSLELHYLRENVLYRNARLDTTAPPDVQLVELSRPDEEVGTTVTVEVARGLSFAMVYSRQPVVQGRLEVRARLIPDFDRATPIPLVSDGIYEARRGWPVERATDRWFVPVPDLFDFSTAPTVTIERNGDSRAVSESIYYVCDSSSSSLSVSAEAMPWSMYAELRPTCRTWDESGRLYVEVAYSEAYDLTITIE